MTHGTIKEHGQQESIDNKWFRFTEKQANTITLFLNIVVVGTACVGAATSGWLAIPSLLKELPFEVPALAANIGYILSVISGVTYAKAQFWDKSYTKIKELLFGHDTEDKKTQNKHKEDINLVKNNIIKNLNDIKEQEQENQHIKNALTKLVKNLYILENPEISRDSILKMETMLRTLKFQLGISQELLNFFLQEKIDLSPSDQKQNPDSSLKTWLTNTTWEVLEWINWIFAFTIVATGSAIAVIVTASGSKNAILSLTGAALFAPAACIAIFTQCCKLALNGDKQMSELTHPNFIKSNEDTKILETRLSILNKFTTELKDIQFSQLQSDFITLNSRIGMPRNDSATQTDIFENSLLEENESSSVFCATNFSAYQNFTEQSPYRPNEHNEESDATNSKPSYRPNEHDEDQIANILERANPAFAQIFHSMRTNTRVSTPSSPAF